MIYAGYHCAGKEWCYENIISPFSRLYLINEGKAAVYMNKKKYELSPGELFIIPKFTFHTYECDNFMNHYYICFFDQLIGGRSLFENTTIRYQLPAKEIDRMLMLRFLELNHLKETRSAINQKSGIPFRIYRFCYLRNDLSYASATTFFTETKERFSLPLRKVTTPSTKAYNVWSLPIPTFSPG